MKAFQSILTFFAKRVYILNTIINLSKGRREFFKSSQCRLSLHSGYFPSCRLNKESAYALMLNDLFNLTYQVSWNSYCNSGTTDSCVHSMHTSPSESSILKVCVSI